MRRILIVLVVATLAVPMLIIASQSASRPSLAQPSSCTKIGTPRADVLAGTKNRDVICALGGKDYAHGGGNNDRVLGGAGRDTLVGGPGKDKLFGAGGNDELFMADNRGGELANGGAGRDQCFVDPGDQTKGCERRFFGVSQHLVDKLSHSFFGGLQLADDLLDITPTPTIPPLPVTVTETITIRPPLPPCDPPPAVLVPPCAILHTLGGGET